MIKLKCTSGDLEWNSEKIARLSQSEILILVFLLKNLNEVSTKHELLTRGWPNSYVSANSLSVAIKNIRKALAPTSFSIETIHGKGYILHGESHQYSIVEQKVDDTNQNLLSTDEIEALLSIDDIYKRVDAGVNRDNNPPPMGVIENKVQSVNSNELSTTINVEKMLSICYFSIIIPLAVAMYLHSEVQYCYQLSPSTKVCGVFYLNAAKQKEIQGLLSNQTGNFFYGYDVYSRKFKIYKMD